MKEFHGRPKNNLCLAQRHQILVLTTFLERPSACIACSEHFSRLRRAMHRLDRRAHSLGEAIDRSKGQGFFEFQELLKDDTSPESDRPRTSGHVYGVCAASKRNQNPARESLFLSLAPHSICVASSTIWSRCWSWLQVQWILRRCCALPADSILRPRRCRRSRRFSEALCSIPCL